MTRDERDLSQDLHELRALDPARAARPGAGREPAARALLDEVLTPPEDRTGASDVPRSTGRWRRWALTGAAAAAVTVGLVTLSPWSAPEHAFATWTPAPGGLSAGTVDELTTTCTSSVAEEALGQQAVVAEERGSVTFVVTATSHDLRYCLLVDGEFRASGSGSAPGRSGHPDLAPTEVRTYLAGGGGSGQDAYTAVIGLVGEDVVGVEVHPRGTVTEPGALRAGELPESITASVGGGYFGAWWPGTATELDLTVHLSDGTVARNVPAFDDDRQSATADREPASASVGRWSLTSS